MVFGSTVMMAFTNLDLTLVILVPVTLAVLGVVYLTKRMYTVFQRLLAELGEVNSRMIENFTGRAAIR